MVIWTAGSGSHLRHGSMGCDFLSLEGKEAGNGEGEWCGFGYVALRSRIMSESIDFSMEGATSEQS
jgi:hypothetical protein